VSQLWLRRYHTGWFRKYNYILGGALDGGAQVMIFILSFAVFGASGVSRPFPAVKLTCLSPFSPTPNVMSFLFRYLSSIIFPPLQWAGNPAKGNVDYCNGNGALD
jgi:hypothetical protein